MKEKIIRLLKEYTGHDNIELTSKGDTAIFATLYCCRKLNPGKVLIPDQGGWLTYKKYPSMLGMEMELVKTDRGMIDLEDLKSKVSDASCFLYCEPAGYFAEQPLKEIYDVCEGKCLVVVDATGAIGNEDFGEYCDFSLGSFGRWKAVNVEYGGYISAREKKFFEAPKEIFNTTSFDESHFELLLEKLEAVRERFKILHKKCAKIKEDLKDFDVIHKDKGGIVVVVGFKSDTEKEKIIKYCKENGYEHTLCPRYIRVEEDAVSIEVKRQG